MHQFSNYVEYVIPVLRQWRSSINVQDEAVKKARARTRNSVLDLEHFRLSSQIRHERAAREFREKIRREEEETRLASKVKIKIL